MARLPYRVLDETWTRHIGDAAILDYVIKLDILAGRRPQDIILYAPPGGRIGNRFLVEQLAQRLRLVAPADELPFDQAAAGALHYHYQFPRQPDGSRVFFWELASRAHQRWSKEGRGPLFELPPDVTRAAGRCWKKPACRAAPGSSRCMCAISAGAARPPGLQAIRNADTAGYLPAIEEITRRGGFVIRMGDAEAPPLPPLTNVIDYGRSWMDVFLLTRSRFVLGSAYGPIFRSAALWRALRADELVAAGHAALARTRYLHPEAAQAGGRRNLFDTERNAAGAGVPVAIRCAISPPRRVSRSRTTIRTSSAMRSPRC